jgi:hypothetical protein
VDRGRSNRMWLSCSHFVSKKKELPGTRKDGSRGES